LYINSELHSLGLHKLLKMKNNNNRAVTSDFR
jgi:hypothetical protein